MYDYDNREDFEDYGKHCWLLTPWKGYRSATIVGQTDKGYIVQVSSGAEIVVYPGKDNRKDTDMELVLHRQWRCKRTDRGRNTNYRPLV